MSALQVRNLENEITKKTAPPCASTDAVFYAGTGMLLCRSEDKVCWGAALSCLVVDSTQAPTAQPSSVIRKHLYM